MDGLVVRPWTEEDAEAMNVAVTASLEHLRPWMPWVAQEPKTLAERRETIRTWERERLAGGQEAYAVELDGEIVGAIGLHHRIGPGGLEMGYWTRVDQAGRGIMTAAVRELCDRAFARGSIDRLEIHHDVANVASGRVSAKAGFTHVEDRPPDREAAPADSGTERIWRLTRAQWTARRAP